MRLLLINSVCGIGSTGKICAGIAEEYEARGYEVKIAYGRDGYVPEKYSKYAVRIGNDLDVKLHALGTRITDRHGLFSTSATKSFLKWADEFNPDELWLHNIHGYYINYKLLFAWIKSRPQMQVKWTLHDCWAFTGHCSYFTYAKCEKWTAKCMNCPQTREYPESVFFDASKQNYEKKRESFCGVKNMTVVVPSQWMGELVKRSFLREYPINVIHNTIDTSLFKPTKSEFAVRKGLENKKIILGVANIWDRRKGLRDFLILRNLLSEKYSIILIGLSDKQIKNLPSGIIGISRTNNQTELVQIYSAADVFLNLTHEDNYPTVNLEAQACGTPCITYRVGGSPESVLAENVVDEDDYAGLIDRIRRVCGEVNE